MLLRNLIRMDHLTIDIQIKDGKIRSIDRELNNNDNSAEIKFENSIVFPGLINSHDHLDFNLFPQLGNKKYMSYVDWGRDIHANNKDIINKVLKVPFDLRYTWGIYKNLINGITTVVNHGERMKDNIDLIHVFGQCNILHSIQFEKNWRVKINNPFAKDYPFVIHIGEGTDESSHKEIDTLLQWNIFRRYIIAVHGIAMNEDQARNFKGLVWCPDSNFFLVGETAQVNRLIQSTNIVFGTDSTLSSLWNIWEHIRGVRKKDYATDQELFDMLTIKPARMWNLLTTGKIQNDFDADLVIARNHGDASAINSFYGLNPEDILMVICKGKIRLFDEDLFRQLDDAKIPMEKFSKISIQKSCKYIFGDLPGLMDRIKTYYPEVEFPIESADK